MFSRQRDNPMATLKGFTQKKCIEFNENISPVSTKDSFKIIMKIVAHYDL